MADAGTRGRDRAIYQAWVVTHQAALLLPRAAAVRLRPLGLDAAGGLTLAVLHAHGTQQMSTLARASLQQPQTTTDLVDRLERRQLVRRTNHPRDRRVILVELTAAGQALAADVTATLAAVMADTIGSEDAAALADLGTALGRVRAVAGRIAGMPAAHFAVATDQLPLGGDGEPVP